MSKPSNNSPPSDLHAERVPESLPGSPAEPAAALSPEPTAGPVTELVGELVGEPAAEPAAGPAGESSLNTVPESSVLTIPDSNHPGAKSLLDDKIIMQSSMGGYRVGQILGQGAMGKVYFAEHEILGRPAAIKVLHNDAADKDAVARFFQEARAASAIDHPGIVKVYDVGENDEGSFLVMELLEGENLEDRLLREERFEVRDAVRFAVQIASALQAAHANGIVHRDLKPGNIFITADPEVDGGERIKILDFGIAKMAVAESESDPNISQTRSDMLLGSPTYMSPEQCRGAQKVDGRADLYSLGCMLFEMLCGRPPFDQQVVAAVIASHLREEPPRPTSFRPELSPGLEQIILQLLAKDADERFQSAQAFIDAMVQQGGHSLIVKTGMSRTLVNASQVFTSMFTVPKKRPFGALIVLGVIGLAVGLFFLFASDDATRDETPTDVVVASVETDAGPEALPEPPRPELRVRMLAPAGSDAASGSAGGDPSEIITIEQVEAMEWDGTIDEATVAGVLSGDLDISIMQGMPLLTTTPDGKIIVPWFITTEPAGASVRFADGTPLGAESGQAAVTPVFLNFEAVQRDDKLIVELPGYEPETIDAKFYMPMRESFTLEPIPEVTIDTEPSGAAVYVEGQKLEGVTTPWTTKPSRKRTQNVTFRLPEYEDYDLALRGGNDFSEPLAMQELTEVRIETKPRKVEVVENGVVVGTTPYTTRKFSIKKGEPFTLTLRGGEKYDDMDLVLGPGQDLSFAQDTIELVPKVRIDVRTRKPREAQVEDVFGAPIATTPWTVYLSKTEMARAVILKHEDYEDYPLEIGPEVEVPSRIEMQEIPEWKVDSRPRKAEIYDAQGVMLGVTPMKFKVPLAVGTMDLILKSPGHEDLAVTLKNDERPPRRFELVELPSVEIETSPKGALVFDRSGAELGETPLRVTFGKDKAALDLTIRKSGYLDAPLTLAFGARSPDRIELTPLETQVELETRPKDVEVFNASGEKLGQTPLTLGFEPGDPPMVLTLRKTGYAEQTVRVGADDDPGRIELERLAIIELASRPPGARVTDGAGKELGVTPYTVEVPRSRDKLTYKLTMPGHLPRTVTVVPTRDRKERIDLEAEPTDVTVAIISDPPGAEVYADGKKVGETPYTVTRKGSSGRTRYSVRKKGYEREDFRLENDKNERKEVELSRCQSDELSAFVNPYCVD